MSTAVPLRISHVQPLSLDLYGHADADWGTNARYFLPNMAIAQAAAGDQPTVHMLTSGRSHRLSVEGVEVRFHRCLQPPRRWDGDRRFARQVSVGMVHDSTDSGADVVHFHGSRSLQPMMAAVTWAARRKGLPVVVQDHGRRPVGRLEAAAQAFAWSRVQRFLAANAETVEQYRAFGIEPDRISVVPNGVDPEVFRPEQRRSGPGRPFRVLVVSRMWEDKDPMSMAEAVAIAAARGTPCEVTIISEGPLRGRVVARLGQAGVAVTVVDRVPQKEMARYYGAADALVLTSLREGFNQATVEAMACGLPVVASDIPGVRDGVGGAGVLLPPRSPELVAGAIQRLAADPVFWCECRRRGLRQAELFTWEAVTAKLRAAYTSAIEEVANG